MSHRMAHACLTTCADSDLLRQVKDWDLAWIACKTRNMEWNGMECEMNVESM